MKTWHRVAIAVLVTVLAVAGVVAYLETRTEYQVMSVSGYLFAVEDGTGTDQFTVSDAGTVDVQGNKIDLDADADTSVTSDTDDQIDVEIGGQDVVSVTGSLARFQVDVYGLAPTLEKSSSYTVTASDSGALFTNDGATGEITFTLPNLIAGRHYCFAARENQTVTIDPDGTDQVLSETDSGGDRVQSGAQWDVLCIVGIADGWLPVETTGTWADAN
jgi:hypothetical protein